MSCKDKPLPDVRWVYWNTSAYIQSSTKSERNADKVDETESANGETSKFTRSIRLEPEALISKFRVG